MTTIAEKTIREILNESDLNSLADVLKKIQFGNMASVIKVVAAGLTAAASFDITTAAFKALSTITGISLRTGENLPAIATVQSLRIVASGTAASVGNYVAGDVGSAMTTAATATIVGIARISDDGKTLTFPNTVTAFTLIYVPRAAVPSNTEFNFSAP